MNNKIVTYLVYGKTPEKTEEVLFSLESALNKYKLQLKVDVMVSDQYCKDDIAEVVSRFPQFRFVERATENDALGKYFIYLFDTAEINMKTINNTVTFLEHNEIDNLKLKKEVFIFDDSEVHSG